MHRCKCKHTITSQKLLRPAHIAIRWGLRPLHIGIHRTYVICVYIAHISETITPVHRKNRGLRPPYIAYIGGRRPPMDNCSWHSSGPAPITHRHSSEIICAYIAHISETITPVHRKYRGLRPAHIGTHRHYIAVIARGLPMCRWSERKP